MDELFSKAKVRTFKYPIVVGMNKDPVDKKKYVEVCLLNPNFVAPEKGLKPWGCKKGQIPPKGYYNVNDNCYSKYFALGFTAWSKLIDTPVIIEKSVKLHPYEVLGEILWELTFYGWSEKQHEKEIAKITNRLKQSMKEIKKGKYIELPPKKKGGWKVIIPDSVGKQLRDILKKKE